MLANLPKSPCLRQRIHDFSVHQAKEATSHQIRASDLQSAWEWSMNRKKSSIIYLKRWKTWDRSILLLSRIVARIVRDQSATLQVIQRNKLKGQFQLITVSNREGLIRNQLLKHMQARIRLSLTILMTRKAIKNQPHHQKNLKDFTRILLLTCINHLLSKVSSRQP